MNLRKLAQGQPCMIRLRDCDGGGETTVLAHYRLNTGMGTKPDDNQGAWACCRCHDAVDFRRKILGMTRDQIRLAFAEGVFRTQEAIRAMREAA